MSIKKSFLESKWYYRVVRVIFFEVLPVLIMAGIIWKLFPNISNKSLEGIIAVLPSNSSVIAIICALIGPAAYLLILNGIWGGFFYIIFGGLEDDTKPKVVATVPSTGQVSQQPIVAQDGSAAVVNYLKQAKEKEVNATTWIILIIIFIWVAYYYSSSPSYTTSTTGGGSSKTKTSTCISTGCGSNWRCSGTYYSSSGAQKSISGCYANKTSVTSLNSWSGICLLCP